MEVDFLQFLFGFPILVGASAFFIIFSLEVFPFLEYPSIRMPHFIIQMSLFTKMQNYKIKGNRLLMHVCPFSYCPIMFIVHIAFSLFIFFYRPSHDSERTVEWYRHERFGIFLHSLLRSSIVFMRMHKNESNRVVTFFLATNSQDRVTLTLCHFLSLCVQCFS